VGRNEPDYRPGEFWLVVLAESGTRGGGGGAFQRNFCREVRVGAERKVRFDGTGGTDFGGSRIVTGKAGRATKGLMSAGRGVQGVVLGTQLAWTKTFYDGKNAKKGNGGGRSNQKPLRKYSSLNG